MIKINKNIYVDFDKHFWFLLWYKWKKTKNFKFIITKDKIKELYNFLENKDTKDIYNNIENNNDIKRWFDYNYYDCNCAWWYFHWFLKQNKMHPHILEIVFQDVTSNDEIILSKEDIILLIEKI